MIERSRDLGLEEAFEQRSVSLGIDRAKSDHIPACRIAGPVRWTIAVSEFGQIAALTSDRTDACSPPTSTTTSATR